MAELVLGMAAPHSGMLGKPADTWLEDGLRDRKNQDLWYRNRRWNYEQLEVERRGEHLERFLTLEERRARHARCRTAIETLRIAYQQTKIDAAVLIGKDQKEIFIDVSPTFAVHIADGIENGPPQRDVYAPANDVIYKGHKAFGEHILRSLQGDCFDIACMTSLPPHRWLQNQIVVPHAYGFIYHDIMLDTPPPSVPVYMNTFYPPNQPSIGRSIAFGKALSKAIANWDGDQRVGIFASGGLSHFVCDEEFDAKVIDAFQRYDLDALARIDENSYQSGNSEVKLFVPVLIAMSERKCPMTLVDYVPCYRTEAGSGEGMGFMYWRQ